MYFFKSNIINDIINIKWKIFDIISEYESITDWRKKSNYIQKISWEIEDKWEKWFEIEKTFLNFIFDNYKIVNFLYKLAWKITDVWTIEILYSLFNLFSTTWASSEIHDNFLSISIWKYAIIFFFEPSFSVMNEIVLFLQEDHMKNLNHIFIHSDMNFYSFLSNRLKTRINPAWMNQVFAKLMKFSHYFTDMSD